MMNYTIQSFIKDEMPRAKWGPLFSGFSGGANAVAVDQSEQGAKIYLIGVLILTVNVAGGPYSILDNFNRAVFQTAVLSNQNTGIYHINWVLTGRLFKLTGLNGNADFLIYWQYATEPEASKIPTGKNEFK